MSRPSALSLCASPNTFPPSPPATIRPESLVREVNNWLIFEPTTKTLNLENISEEDFEELESKLLAQGTRLRYDWNAKRQILCLSMPHQLHEALMHWASTALLEINPYLEKYAAEHTTICSNPSLQLSGSVSCKVVDHMGESHARQPDQSIVVHDRNIGRLLDQGWPTVVFEACNIIYDLSYPLTQKLKSKIGIWIRSSTDINEVYPLDSCWLDEEKEKKTHDRNKGDEVEGQNSDNDDQDEASAGHANWIEFDDTYTKYAPYGKPAIELRDGWVGVYDEEEPNKVPHSLVFDTLDFIRLCRQKQAEEPVYETISVSLGNLKLSTELQLFAQREAKGAGVGPYETSKTSNQSTKRARNDGESVPRKWPRSTNGKRCPQMDKGQIS